jgi:hypothetical protein
MYEFLTGHCRSQLTEKIALFNLDCQDWSHEKCQSMFEGDYTQARRNMEALLGIGPEMIRAPRRVQTC